MVYLDLDGEHMRMCVFLGICQCLVLSIFLIFTHLLVISLSLMALNSTLCWWFYLQFRDGRDHGNVLHIYSWLFYIPLRFLLVILAQMVKNLPANVGDLGWIPKLGRSPGEENGNPFQDSCLENSMGRGAWQATVHSVAELDTSEQLIHTHTLISKPASFAAFPSQLSYFILSIAKNLDASFASLLRRPGPCYHMGLHCSHTLSLSSLIWICAKAPAGCLTSRRL